MTNNTERKAFEAVEFLDELMELYDFTLPPQAYCELRAALSQRDQKAPSLYDIPDNELPGMWEKADFEGGKPDVVRGPAPSLCTAEEAAELVKGLGHIVSMNQKVLLEYLTVDQLAIIINAYVTR
jgi:hypothetical protein